MQIFGPILDRFLKLDDLSSPTRRLTRSMSFVVNFNRHSRYDPSMKLINGARRDANDRTRLSREIDG